MKNEFMMAINQLCHERQLPQDVVLEAVEAALISAYKRNFGAAQIITAKIDPNTGEARVFAEKEVVQDVFDDKSEITVEDAQAYVPGAVEGDVIQVETTPTDFGRIAAQTAKQVILQRIREAEREALYKSYAEREGEIVNGTVHKIEPYQVTLSLGKVEAILPRSEQIPTERYGEGQRLRAYVSEVQRTSRGPHIVVSRTHRNMLRRLLEVEVPEIYNGTVEIKSIAREAGYRSKVAVAALQEGVDPVGSCVGMRGVRIQSIVNELNGEKIDVVQWSPDMAYFIANGLSPAKVLNVFLHYFDGDKTATVVVPDKQLSLAIGKEGQNARLAAKLTGWRIDIKSAYEAAVDVLRTLAENAALREALKNQQEVFSLVATILEEKEGHELTDGELQLLSEAIGIVGNAQLVLEEERRAAEKAARAKEEKADLLAEAEAILTGAAPEAGAEEAAPAEVTEAPETAAAEEVADLEAVEVEPAQVEAVEETEAVEAPVGETPAGEAVETVPEPEGEAEVVGVAEPEPQTFDAGLWNENEEDLLEKQQQKKKARRKKRRLVYDEDLGEVIAERRRKPSRRKGEWEDFDIG
ncbi:MAG: transcription termination factor NusA [Anaerolineae bacterium]